MASLEKGALSFWIRNKAWIKGLPNERMIHPAPFQFGVVSNSARASSRLASVPAAHPAAPGPRRRWETGTAP